MSKFILGKRTMLKIGEIMSQYSEYNINNYEPVSIGKLGIRLRSEVFGRTLSNNNYKNKVIYKDSLVIGIGSKRIEYSVLYDDAKYSVSPDYKTFKLGIDAAYWDIYFSTLQTKLFYLYAKENARNGRRIDIPSLLAHKVYIHDEENIKKITLLLSQIDNLIHKQNSKIKMLIQTKDVVVNEFIMQIKSGTRYKLGDLVDYVNADKVSDTKLYPKMTVSINKKGLKILEDTLGKADSRPFYLRKEGEIIIGKQNYFNGSITIITSEFHNTISSNAIISFMLKQEYNTKYVYELISNKNYFSKKEILVNGTGQKELSKACLMNFDLTLPRKEVQDNIANLLSSMDSCSLTP